MIIQPKSILGRGPAFPMNANASRGLTYSEGVDRINQSLYIILSTPKGRRLMMPEFGSSIDKYRFDPLDAALMEKLRYAITEDIKRWEPRILLNSVEFFADNQAIDNNTLYINISYRIINTTISSNYVYPYRLETYDTLKISYE